MELAYSFTVALFLTIALIPILIKFSAALQLVDDPNDNRKVHSEAIPRSGGLAIVLGVFIPLAFILPMQEEFSGLVLGALTIVIFGYLDDRYELDYKWKFLGQIIAVLAVMYGGVMLSKVPLMGLDTAPLWISSPLTFFFLLGTINAVNLIDGLDGLAAGTSLFGLAIIVVFGLQLGRSEIALVAATVIGGLLGFLRYNTFPARIFMGDTGSQFLGYVVAALAIMVSQGESSAVSPAIPLMILGLPILDTLTVMAIRIKEGRSPFSPDKNHLHHQLMSLGFKHFEAVGVIYIIQVVLITSTYLMRFESDLLILASYCLLCVSIVTMLYLAHTNQWRIRYDYEHTDRDRRNHFLRRLHWLYKHSAVVIEGMMSVMLIVMACLVAGLSDDFAAISLIVGLVLLVLFIIARQYATILARAGAYTASVFAAYLYTTAGSSVNQMYMDICFGALAFLILLVIRITRREDFRLDAQDLLVLVLIILVPQLPFETLSEHSVGHISLRLAVLMYGCELVLGKNKNDNQNKGNFKILIMSSVISLIVVGLPVLS